MFSLKKMMWISAQVVIDAPPDKVFSYLTDFDRHHEWLGIGVPPEIEKTSEGPVGVGTTFKSMEVAVWPWRYKADIVVTEYAPNERLAFDWLAPGGACQSHSIHLEPEPVSGGTRVTVERELVRSKGWGRLLMPLFLPVMPVVRHISRRKIQGMGSRLKEYYQRPAL